MDQFIKSSKSELTIITEIRTLKPYEKITIVADANGKPGQYLVIRSSKGVLSDGNMRPERTRITDGE
jgi:hypothetical protein